LTTDVLAKFMANASWLVIQPWGFEFFEASVAERGLSPAPIVVSNLEKIDFREPRGGFDWTV
jgi:hypothetical protein